MIPVSQGQLEGQLAVVEARALADTASDMVQLARAFVARRKAQIQAPQPLRAASGSR